jgi:hypothetical protein
MTERINVRNNPLAKARHQIVPQARAQSEQARNCKRCAKIAIQQHAVRGLKPINNAAHRKRHDQRDTGRQNQRNARQRHHHPVGFDKRPKPAQSAKFF